SSSTTEPIVKSAGLSVSKTASILDTDSDGDTTAITDASDDVKYTVVVKNTHSTTLTTTTFTDTQSPGSDATIASLAPRASHPFTVTYSLHQRDIDSKPSISNTAPPPNGLLSTSSSTTEPIAKSAGLSVSKTASILDTDSDGDTTAITDASDDVKYTV